MNRFILTAMGAVVVAAPLFGAEFHDWDRYQCIVDRAPFGPIFSAGSPEFENPATNNVVVDPIPDGPSLSETVKVSAITVFGGVPAAGFTDLTDNKSYYLYEGRSAGDFTLVAVHSATRSILLRKGDQEEELTMGGGAVESGNPVEPSVKPSTQTAAKPARPTAGPGAGGYKAAQQQRTEAQRLETQARIEAAIARREEERAKREEEKKAEKERREKNLQAIIAGQPGDPSIELTREEFVRLGEAGFDVAEALQTLDANEADRKREEAEKREAELPPRLKHREGESTEEYIKRIRREREEKRAARAAAGGRHGSSPE